MQKDYREILSSSDARDKLKKGVDTVVDIVKSTLGPYGRNYIVDQTNHKKVPRISNDGATIARELTLKDPIENLGCQAVIEASIKTDQMVGDGTSTTLVLTQAILNSIKDNKMVVGKKKNNVIDTKKQIEKEGKEVVVLLEKQAKKDITLKELEIVANTAGEDEKMGKVIADMAYKIGPEGFILVEDTFDYKTTTETISGMKISGSYAAEYLVTDPRKKQIKTTEVPILITNEPLEGNVNEIKKKLNILYNIVKQQGYSGITMLAPKYSTEALKVLHATMADFIQGKNDFIVFAAKTPSLSPNELEDIACYTGGKFIDIEKNMKIEDVIYEDFGKIEKLVAGEDDIILFKGAGKEQDREKRIKDIQGQIKQEKDIATRKRFERRIASLIGTQGIIKVGAGTDIEKYYKKDKIDDAIHACQAALQDGVVKGGGLALKEISDKLPKKYLLKEALLSPYNQIQDNAGGDLKIENVLDPVKVVKIALENAVSFSATFLTIEHAIAWADNPELKDLLKENE